MQPAREGYDSVGALWLHNVYILPLLETIRLIISDSIKLVEKDLGFGI